MNESFNGTFFNISSTPISNITDISRDEEDFTAYVIMLVTSALLGLMILITVIGKLIFTVFNHFENFIIAHYKYIQRAMKMMKNIV